MNIIKLCLYLYISQFAIIVIKLKTGQGVKVLFCSQAFKKIWNYLLTNVPVLWSKIMSFLYEAIPTKKSPNVLILLVISLIHNLLIAARTFCVKFKLVGRKLKLQQSGYILMARIQSTFCGLKPRCCRKGYPTSIVIFSKQFS